MKRIHRLRRGIAAGSVAISITGLLAATTAAAPASAAPTCLNGQVQRAPIVTGDVRDDGKPVAVTADRRGKRVPIVLVHGAGDDGTISSDSRTGPFAHPVDLAAATAAVADDPRSLLGELQNLPGTDVFTFDYSKWAGKWVDDGHLGPALGSALTCLRAATGEPAVVVTHSTGSLVARWALTHVSGGGGDPASLVSTVVTFGAPDAGATLGLLDPGGAVAAERAGFTQAAPLAGALRLLAAHCAAAGLDPADGSLCDQLDRTAPLARSDLARALTAGSSQLTSLPAWPKNVAVHALHASTSLTLPAHGWFGSAAPAAALTVGDLEDLTAALPKAAKPAASCAVTLSPGADGGGWKLAATDSDDPGTDVADATSPCFSGDLTRAAELVATTRALVLADLFRRQPLVAKDLLAAPVPALCQDFAAGTLVNGVLPGYDATQAMPPTLESTDTYRTGSMVALGDLDGDGVGDAAGVVNCNAGGVGWPDYVVMWGSGLRLLGAYDMGEAVGDARSGTRSLTYEDGAIVVDSLDARPWDGGCCASGHATVTLTWNGRVVVAKVQHLQGPDDITFTSYGAVKLGMGASDLTRLGYTSSPLYDGCVQYAATGKPYVIVDPRSDQSVSMSDFSDNGFGPHTWPQGIGVGSSVSEVESAYRDDDVDVHLDESLGQGSSGIVVKGDGGVITFYVDPTTSAVSTIQLSDSKHYGSFEDENACR